MRGFGILQHFQLRPTGHLTHLVSYIFSIATTVCTSAEVGVPN
jgi:hypothetical protein